MQDTIKEFAAKIRCNQEDLEKLKALTSVSEITNFSRSMGYELGEKEVSEFVEQIVRQTPADVESKIIASGTPLHFDEESILRFAARRLQIDSDY